MPNGQVLPSLLKYVTHYKYMKYFWKTKNSGNLSQGNRSNLKSDCPLTVNFNTKIGILSEKTKPLPEINLVGAY